MMRFLLGTAWLAASVYAGYLLTARSFAFLEDPGFGFGADAPLAQILNLDADAIRERLPAPGESPESWHASLSAEEQACLQRAVSESTLQAALRGEDVQLTAAETLAISLCLK